MPRLFFCLAFGLFLLSAASSQDCKKTGYSTDEQGYLNVALTKFAACPLPLDSQCRATLAQALEHVYGLKDFGGESKYMTPAEISKKVASDSNWAHVGSASDQNALKSAQDSANCGKQVIAVAQGFE